MKIQSIMITGRRWFQRTYGNTYNTADIYINGEHAAKLDMEYGYGDHYMERAGKWLEQNGYMPDRKHYPHGGGEAVWRYCDRHNIQCSYMAMDVARQRDL